MPVAPVRSSSAAVFASALRGEPCEVVGLAAEPHLLPVLEWTRPVDSSDLAVLAHCRAETLDVGCGPGRMTRALVDRGHLVLGIDVVPEAVRMTRARGAAALVRDVFDPVPAEGRWRTVLLADGNLGIGGDPHALLRRLHAVLAPGGRVVADLAPPGAGLRRHRIRLRTSSLCSVPMAWAVVGADAIGYLAVGCGFTVRELCRAGDRWTVVLEQQP